MRKRKKLRKREVKKFRKRKRERQGLQSFAYMVQARSQTLICRVPYFVSHHPVDKLFQISFFMITP